MSTCLLKLPQLLLLYTYMDCHLCSFVSVSPATVFSPVDTYTHKYMCFTIVWGPRRSPSFANCLPVARQLCLWHRYNTVLVWQESFG